MLLVSVPSEPAKPARVVSFHWYRKVGGREGLTGHDRRPFWPNVEPEELAGWIEGEKADPRWWSPRNSEERYWVTLDDGTEVDLTLEEWAKLGRGSVVVGGH